MSALKLLLYITERNITSSSPAPRKLNHTQVITADYNRSWHKERADPQIAEAKSKKRVDREGKGRVALFMRLRTRELRTGNK